MTTTFKTPKMRMISIEQQLAEKLHTYSFPRVDRLNSRVKDLIDMLLLIELKSTNPDTFKKAIQTVFKARNTHSIPDSLDEPPQEWATLYQALANECGIKQSMSQASRALDHFFLKHVAT